jgi:hypothetical protein
VLRQVRLDQQALRSLAQRVGADRGHRHVDRLRAAVPVDQRPAQRLQRVQQPLPDPLALRATA